MEIARIAIEAGKKTVEVAKKVHDVTSKIEKTYSNVKKVTDEKNENYLTKQIKSTVIHEVKSTLSESLNNFFDNKENTNIEKGQPEGNRSFQKNSNFDENGVHTKESGNSKNSMMDNLNQFLDKKEEDKVTRTEQKLLSDDNKLEHSNVDENTQPKNTLVNKEQSNLHVLNSNLAGKEHAETGVPFETKTILINGEELEVVIPIFPSHFDAQLPKELYKERDAVQFKECSLQLLEKVINDPDFALKFDEVQFEQILSLEKPDGYTWHHDYKEGKMQLVDTRIHNKTAHIGGKALWGGGQENR